MQYACNRRVQPKRISCFLAAWLDYLPESEGVRAFAALIPFTCNFYRCLEGLSGKRLGRFQVARTRIRHILHSFFFSFYVSSEIQVARMLLASCKVLLASCKVPLASCKVPLASYKVPLASCKVPLASCKVGLASCKAHLRMSDQRCPLPYISLRQGVSTNFRKNKIYVQKRLGTQKHGRRT